jgi:SAM-dependent methyltransferase
MTNTSIQALADETLYPAVLKMWGAPPKGRILDVPAGRGAFAQTLLQRGYDDIDCLDINASAFQLHQTVRFHEYDAHDPLPFPSNSFDYVFSLEGIEHFPSPWVFIMELCRVLKPGGKLYISTPNTFSVDARLKYLFSGYFPRFRPLMQDPSSVMNQDVDDAHICPIYFWQLYYFLLQGNISIDRIDANALLKADRTFKRWTENFIASLIRRNIRRRNFPDKGVTSNAVLFGDCIIIEGTKRF